VPLEECEAIWAANQSIDHDGVYLSHGWHLNRVLVAGGYGEEALLQSVLEASKDDVDKISPGYSDAIVLTGMVAEHLASLPPQPPLPPHAPLQAAYEGQEVPPPPGGVVINPPPQPEPEVFVDLVSEDEE
jgi:hypothetical protein